MATQFEIDCALMAGVVYRSTRDPKNRLPIPDGWNEIVGSYLNLSSGFEAVSFTSGSKIVISFAGTDPSDVSGDGAADIALGFGMMSVQLKQAADYYLAVKAANPGATITLTGHSLGGGLASLIAVMFDETAVTFDQAPFRNSALTKPVTDAFGNPVTDANGNPLVTSVAQELRAYLTGRAPAALLTRLDAYIVALDPATPMVNPADTLEIRQVKVSNINVQGEVLSALSALRIGSESSLTHGTTDLFPIDLHLMDLLAAFELHDPFRQVTFKLPDLERLLFDGNLYNYALKGSKENFITRLVRHQAGGVDDVPVGGDSMLDRFTQDLEKIAQDGGLTMSDAMITKAMMAFAMQKYYDEQAGGIGAGEVLFKDISGGIQFDTTAIAADITTAKGYEQYFQNFLNIPRFFSENESALIKEKLANLKDWYVQAGAGGMTASDSGNRGAFMLGGEGTDTLTGGTGNDLLVGGRGIDILTGGTGTDTLIGGQGGDILKGGAGNDTYYAGHGDVIEDSDFSGKIYVGNTLLTGGSGDGYTNYYYESADKQVGYYNLGNGVLVKTPEGTVFIKADTQQLQGMGIVFNKLPHVWRYAGGARAFPNPNTPEILPPGPIGPIISSFEKAGQIVSPIVLDLNGDGIATTGVQSGAYFDHDANGFAENTGWVNGEDGILVLDRNGNGTIDSGRELFGSETLLASGQKAANGYVALAELDANHDGQIDAQDAAYTTLNLWKDANGDGVSSAAELFTLADAGVRSIATDSTTVNVVDANGNTVKQVGTYTRTDDSTANSADIWFNVDKANTFATDWLPETAAVAALPDLQGYGNVRNLHQAMLYDTNGNLQNLVQQFVDATDVAVRHALCTQIIYAWTGVTDINPGSRGFISDARQLYVLEAFMGKDYIQGYGYNAGTPDTGWNAGTFLTGVYNQFADALYNQLMGQTHLKPVLDSISVKWDATTDQFVWDTSDMVTLLQSLYANDPSNSISELAGVLKINGSGGTEVLNTLRAQGDVAAGGFAGWLGGLGANNLVGDDGNNILTGTSQGEALYGNKGNDTLDGSAGNDYLQGGEGNDVYLFNRGSGQDSIFDMESALSSDGNVDTVRFGEGISASDISITRHDYDIVLSINGTSDQLTIQNWGGGNIYRIERFEFADGAVWDATQMQSLIASATQVGGSGDDALMAWAGEDSTIQGLGGNDTLIGFTGNDTLDGGAGNDALVGGGGTDTLLGGEGNDKLFGDSDQTPVSDHGNDYLDGGAGDDYLRGYGGDDVLLGGDGNDMMLGEEGNDSLDGGAGTDVMDGSSGNDTLVGGAGNDTLLGGTGADILVGGADDDYYEIDNAGDTIVELANEGDDFVKSSLSYTLGANLERLTLDGTANIDATGNSAVNGIWGNSGNNILTGGAGNDFLAGNAGNDVYIFNRGDGQDTIDNTDVVGAIDILRFGAGVSDSEVLAFRSGNHMYLNIKGTTDQIVFAEYYGADTVDGSIVSDHKIDRVEFANGVVWDQAMIQSVVDRALTNHAPTVNTTLPVLETSAGTLFSYTVPADTITDPDAWDSITYSMTMSDGSSVPTWLSLDAATGTISGRSDTASAGSLQFVLWGTDNYGYSTGENVTLNIVPDHAPVLASPLADQAVPNGIFNYTVPSSAFTDTDVGDVLTYSATLSDGSALPDWMSFDPPSLTFSGSPVSMGTTSVRVTATDGSGLSASDVFDIVITAQNLAINGTAGNDTLNGGLGNDTLNGFAGNDVLNGGAGDDALNGGTGADIMRGGLGDDTYVVDNIADVVTENLNEGNDTVQSSITYSLSANVENLILTGATAIDATGNSLDNKLTGNSAANILNGGTGADTMIGGAGNDTYIVDNVADVVVETSTLATEIDTVQSSVTYTLSNNVENLTLTGTTSIDGAGNALNNTITGNSGNNVLSGGAGNDTYVVQNTADVIIESANAGTDDVQSSVDYTLSNNVENLTLVGTSAINGAGNTLNNTLTGNAGDNVLDGGAGVDTLAGGDGNDQLNGGGNAGGTYYTNDTLSGGLGNDTYLFGRGSGYVTILETQTDVMGNVDTVRFGADINPGDVYLSQDTVITNGVVTQANLIAQIRYPGSTYTDNLIIKNFFATQDGQWKVEQFVFENGTIWTPSSISERFIGATASSDTLSGFLWGETIDGLGGRDVIYGNAGDDILKGGEGNDTLYGDDYAATVAGNDTLLGGTGNDSLIGGQGNDTYIYQVGDGIDTITDTLGNDKIVFGADILPADLTLFQDLGSLIVVLNGNMQTRLTINGIASANNKIEQFVFDDGTIWDSAMILSQTIAGSPNAMVGTAGNDVFIVDNSGDTIAEGAGQGVDTVQTSVSYTLPTNVENITASGYLNLLLTGNTLNNTIIGNVGNNVLDGGGLYKGWSDDGGDTLIGGAGDDTYYVTPATGDVVVEQANEGNDTVIANFSYTLSDNVENLTIKSNYLYPLTATGNVLDNVITGNSSTVAYIDSLGRFIGDTIDGGAGADTMTMGGGGTFYVDNIGDRVQGSGLLNVFSSVDFVLPEFAGGVYPASSFLTLTGSNAIRGVGNGGENTLDGRQNSAANVLEGGAGDDTYLAGANDTIVEQANGGSDTLMVYAEYLGKYKLSSNIENLVLSSTNTNMADLEGSDDANRLVGNGGANTILGLGGNDRIEGGNNWNDILDGGDGNDWIYGSGNLFGGAGDDQLTSVYSGSILTGGTGNDIMTGQGLQDTYVFSRGDGQDIVLDYSQTLDYYGNPINSLDTIDFTGDLAANEIWLSRVGDDLIASVIGSNDRITVQQHFVGDTADISHRIDQIQFADGTVWTPPLIETRIARNNANTGSDLSDVLAGGTGTDIIQALGGDDFVSGGAGNDILEGGAGNDTLLGNAGNDTLVGGAGDDMLQGSAGADIYRFGRGAGVDTVIDSITVGEVDTILLDDGLLPSQIIVRNSGLYNEDLTLSILGDTAQLTIKYFNNLDANSGRAKQIRFADGTVWDAAKLSYLSTTIVGTSANDILTVDGSANNLYGLDGDDTLIGLSSNDRLDGGIGADTMSGGDGNDTYVVDDVGDVVNETATSSSGVDTVESSISYTLGANQENLTLTGTAAINGTGNTQNNTLVGNVAANILSGGSGTDTMLGGAGNDTYVVDSAGDVVVENLNEGTDLVQSSVTYTLAANVENLTLTGNTAVNGTGNALGNSLIGNSANNTLTGGDGNDTLDGGTGNDTMVGGLGDDTYVVNVSTDVVTEGASAGNDTVQSNVTLTLATNVENLVLTGTSAINGTGNTLNNVLTGNSANNTLSGGTGTDTMIGGAGNDTYIVDNIGDVVTENASEGTDLVQASVSYTLAANVESLTLTGTTAINGTGNALDNVLTGNSANNTLTGGDGNDTLDGGTGNDTMVGGLGNDLYVVNVSTDVVTEAAGAGNDTVQSSVTLTLAANVENLTLTGTTAINGTGNALDNILIGNSANNTLTGGDGNDTIDGGTGNDTMVGGLGDDTYVVNVSTDVVTEAASAGNDTIQSAVTLTLTTNVENLVLTGTTAINGTGNTLNNLVRGNTAINTLNGGTGNDILEGGDGNDILTDTSGTALFNGGAGADTITGGASAEIFLGGLGNDTYTTAGGNDIILFNKGDGQDTFATGGTGSDTLSLGGSGLTYADLTFSKSTNDLVLKVGTTDQITFKDWYAATPSKPVTRLQVMAEAMAGFVQGGSNPLLDQKVENFNFTSLVGAFDAARAANSSLTSWALTNALTNFQLAGSDTAAMGGDLAYQYGKNGTLAGIGVTPALSTLSDTNLGTNPQALNSLASLQTGTVRLS